eukprot:scaffold15875_cov17-Tisochrysis_lutea.AAC.2
MQLILRGFLGARQRRGEGTGLEHPGAWPTAYQILTYTCSGSVRHEGTSVKPFLARQPSAFPS